MKPDLGHALGTAGFGLMGEISPLLAGTYREGSVNTIGALLLVASIEQERAAETRVQGIEDLRRLFKEAAHLVGENLGGRLRAAASRDIESYLISALTAQLNDLKTLLIELQTAAEEMTGSEGENLRSQIWQVLERDAERNMISLG